MVVVLNPLFSSCCKIGKREAGKFERARGLKALASVLWDSWSRQPILAAIRMFGCPEYIRNAGFRTFVGPLNLDKK